MYMTTYGINTVRSKSIDLTKYSKKLKSPKNGMWLVQLMPKYTVVVRSKYSIHRKRDFRVLRFPVASTVPSNRRGGQRCLYEGRMISVPAQKDLEGQEIEDTITSRLSAFGATGPSRVDWPFNLSVWGVLLLVANILPTPLLFLLVLNCAFLLFNIEAVSRVGTSHTPRYVFFLMVLQFVVCLLYGTVAVKAIFQW